MGALDQLQEHISRYMKWITEGGSPRFSGSSTTKHVRALSPSPAVISHWRIDASEVTHWPLRLGFRRARALIFSLEFPLIFSSVLLKQHFPRSVRGAHAAKTGSTSVPSACWYEMADTSMALDDARGVQRKRSAQNSRMKSSVCERRRRHQTRVKPTLLGGVPFTQLCATTSVRVFTAALCAVFPATAALS